MKWPRLDDHGWCRYCHGGGEDEHEPECPVQINALIAAETPRPTRQPATPADHDLHRQIGAQLRATRIFAKLPKRDVRQLQDHPDILHAFLALLSGEERGH